MDLSLETHEPRTSMLFTCGSTASHRAEIDGRIEGTGLRSPRVVGSRRSAGVDAQGRRQPSRVPDVLGPKGSRKLSLGQLRESQGEKLIPTGETAQTTIAAIAFDALAELIGGQVIHQLREDGAVFMLHCGKPSRAKTACAS